MIRRIGLFAVTIGALALSFNGQVAAVAPLLGDGFAVVFALTFDLGTLLALHEVTSAAVAATRRWSWVALFLAGGTALGLNTWHALESGLLPAPAAVAVGAGPVVLAWVLSHMVALTLAEQPASVSTESTEPGPETSGEPVEALPKMPEPAPVPPEPEALPEPEPLASEAVPEVPEAEVQPETAPDVEADDPREQARELLRSGEVISGKALGERFGRSDSWGRAQIRAVKAERPHLVAVEK
ncbi:hypothetical protein DFQ14_12214 [Halopolyspora algeriensis]|uniref:DUF2637 domain-containing protein n=1 Tax=Halopolyspora algeriensis TaxID=1500506 RepID=A0A368VHJ0_9ACTN|nr:hypothetical protein [Halopolyspora algeriensis]RCW38471.1 hypothetical protein DFQ14_12214 [Halopolyspora algeriensis]TQM42648.1 hypothetical protein FHU43_4287 [Halopolyspora algeriensis]